MVSTYDCEPSTGTLLSGSHRMFEVTVAVVVSRYCEKRTKNSWIFSGFRVRNRKVRLSGVYGGVLMIGCRLPMSGPH